MITTVLPDIDVLIPHRGAMQLIDKVVESTESSIVAEANPARCSPFMLEGLGLPTYVGLEMMAQTVCAFGGLQGVKAGLAPKIGLLLGCRRYTAHRATLALAGALRISANLAFEDGAMAAFECVIFDADGKPLAEGTVTAFNGDGLATAEREGES